MSLLLTALTIAAVAALLWALRFRSRWHRTLKMVAATGFVAVALSVGALDTSFGRFVLVALGLSWVGDLLLSYTSTKTFLGGLVAFLLAHVVYVVAFTVRGVSAPHPLQPIAVLGASGLAVWWLLPALDRKMRGPVLAYVAAITAMVIFAAASAESDPDARLWLGAVMFYASDLTVARDRFVSPGPENRMVGLPLYFGGQLLLAWSAGG